MPALKIYDTFISHAWVYNAEYYRLVEMLDSAPNFSWRNYSVPEHDPLIGGNKTKLAEELHRQIRPVNIVLVIAGMYVAHREWIQKEIDIAKSYSKPIVGIKPWGSERIPTAVTEAALEIVGWNTDSIVGAIRRNAL